MKSLYAALCASLILAAPALAKDPPKTGQEKLAEIIKGRVAGKPVDCIPLNSIRSTQIIDRTAIVYDTGGTIYVNTPPSGAEFLDSDDVLVSRTTGSQLCSLDLIRLVDQSTRMSTGSVGLGKFVPYTKPRG